MIEEVWSRKIGKYLTLRNGEITKIEKSEYYSFNPMGTQVDWNNTLNRVINKVLFQIANINVTYNMLDDGQIETRTNEYISSLRDFLSNNNVTMSTNNQTKRLLQTLLPSRYAIDIIDRNVTDDEILIYVDEEVKGKIKIVDNFGYFMNHELHNISYLIL